MVKMVRRVGVEPTYVLARQINRCLQSHDLHRTWLEVTGLSTGARSTPLCQQLASSLLSSSPPLWLLLICGFCPFQLSPSRMPANRRTQTLRGQHWFSN